MSHEFDQISSQIPIVMWTTDRDLSFTSIAGGGVVELEASRQSDHPPASLFELFQTDDPSFEPIAFHRRALNGESVAYEYEFAGRFYDTHLEPLRTSGKVAGVIGVATDITDQKRATKYRDTQFVTTKILAESNTLHEAIIRFLEAICRGVDWDFGRMWHRNGCRKLHLGAQWQSPNFVTEKAIVTAPTCPGPPCVACLVSESGQAT
jgi:hypothetical protein